MSLAKAGDIGIANEKDLADNGFPTELIEAFFGQMRIGDFSRPVRFATGRWYIFKLLARNLVSGIATIESPGVRQQVVDDLIKQHTEIVKAELLETALNNGKIVNYLATAAN
jgi:hypothetical protein